jgi:Protein of unknown function (DUF2281)
MTSQTIDLVDAVQTKMRSLSLSQQQTVVDFIEFLASKQVAESSGSQNRSPRVFGLHAGMGEIHEGFEDPLPDEFWSEEL